MTSGASVDLTVLYMQIFPFASYFAFKTSQFAVQAAKHATCVGRPRPEEERVVTLNNQMHRASAPCIFHTASAFFSNAKWPTWSDSNHYAC